MGLDKNERERGKAQENKLGKARVAKIRQNLPQRREGSTPLLQIRTLNC